MLRNVKTPQILTNERACATSRLTRRQMLHLGKPQDRTASPTHWLLMTND
ncbi:MAG: hypothetical protein HC862_07670 [Scytonema sp. RU_4_4]|nr:hypothetical protein [Scytonema sp. RU_4_4]